MNRKILAAIFAMGLVLAGCASYTAYAYHNYPYGYYYGYSFNTY